MKIHFPEKYIRPFTAVLIIIFMLVFRIFFFTLPSENLHEKSYKGMLRIFDCAQMTIQGSRFSFITTVSNEFAEKKTGVQPDIYKINDISPIFTANAALSSSSAPDVIRYNSNFTALEGKILKDKNWVTANRDKYKDFLKTDNTDELLVDVCYDISLLIYNKEIFRILDVPVPQKRQTHQQFLQTLALLESRDREDIYNTIDFYEKDEKEVFPFSMGAFPDFLNRVCDYLPHNTLNRTPESIRNDFYTGKTAIYAGTLKNINYLIRNRNRETSFGYAYTLFPGNEDSIIVKDIITYAFLKSENEEKNTMLKEFAEYFLSEQTIRYTENLGLLPATKKSPTYKQYPHLRKLNELKGKHILYRDIFSP